MTWLFGQLWFLMLIAFVVGVLVAWLIATLGLPHEDELEAGTGASSRREPSGGLARRRDEAALVRRA